MKIAPQLKAEIEAHVRAEYPKESCGLIVNGRYVPCGNFAREPEQHFVIRGTDYVAASKTGAIEAVVHSHPGGPVYPNAADMKSQIDTGVPWIIVSCDAERCHKWTMWGDSLPIAPIIGREFMHGVTDCYSIIRDTFRLGREELTKQDILNWPFDPILLPEFPRDDEWWRQDDQDLYAKGFGPAGFREIPIGEVRTGDVFLAKIKSEKINHGGILLDNGLLLHHLPLRPSRREPAHQWAKFAHLWIRHEAAK